MMKRFLAALSLLLLPAAAFAQTATTTTTVTTAMTSTATSVVLASVTGVTTNSALFIDNEAMTVLAAPAGLVARVARTGGGPAVAHAANAIVYVATQAQRPSVFRTVNPSGACTRSDYAYLPVVNTSTAEIWDCPTSVGLWINLKRVSMVECRALLIADMIDQSCFTADRPYVVSKITEIHTTAEAGGTLTIIPRKQTTTQACASGASLATALNGVGTAQTLQSATLTTTSADLLLSSGDRLCMDFTDDTAGELAGVTMTFQLFPR